MKYDFHTHTVYSTKKHAKGTVEENVLEARKKGFTESAQGYRRGKSQIFGHKSLYERGGEYRKF